MTTEEIALALPLAPAQPFQLGDRVRMIKRYVDGLPPAEGRNERRRRYTITALRLVGPKSDHTGVGHSWCVDMVDADQEETGCDSSWLELAE